MGTGGDAPRTPWIGTRLTSKMKVTCALPATSRSLSGLAPCSPSTRSGRSGRAERGPETQIVEFGEEFASTITATEKELVDD